MKINVRFLLSMSRMRGKENEELNLVDELKFVNLLVYKDFHIILRNQRLFELAILCKFQTTLKNYLLLKIFKKVCV